MSGTVRAALPEPDPPVTHFIPDLDVYPQNFAIAMDTHGRVFIGNTEGVLIYDGRYWSLVPLDNGDIVRSLAHDGANRIYVGGYDSFGYLEQSSTGRFEYRNLTPRYSEFLKGELFADIWRIAVADGVAYFVGLEHLFRFDAGSQQIAAWRHERSFGPIAFFDNRVLLQFRGAGLKQYQDGDWLPVDGPDLSTILLTSMPVVNADSMLVVSAEDSWFRYDGTKFTPLPQFDQLPHKGSITHATAINDSTLVLTTQLGKIVYVDLITAEAKVVDVATGFLPDAVISGRGDTLVVDDLGFHSVHWPARWQKIDALDGLVGTVNRVVDMNGRTIALTSSGAFVSEPDTRHFELIGWTDYEAWDLLVLDDESLLFADSYEIKHIAPDGTTKVVDRSTTARIFKQSAHHADTVYVGTEFGLQVLVRDATGFQSVYRNDDWDNMRVTQIIELGPNELLLGSERGGIRQVTIANRETWEVSQRLLGQDDGLEYGDINQGAFAYEWDGTIVASTAAGLYELHGSTFEPTELDGLAGQYTKGKTIHLTRGHDESWAFLSRQLFRKNGSWAEEDVSALNRGAVSVVEYYKGKTLIGGLGSLLIFDGRQQRQVATAQAVMLGSASLYKASTDTAQALPLNQIQYGGSDSRLTLRFAVADFNNPDRVRFRTRLKPNEVNFSPWSATSEHSLVALAPGDYEFQVESRDSLGRVSSLAVPVVVQPQWHETLPFRLASVLIAALGLYLLANFAARARGELLAREKARLEAMVHERTRALQSANQQLDRMAHLDGLTQIPNRRKLDSYLEDVWKQCVERNRVMAVVLIDVDHFKKYNDSHGHQAGDDLLIELAKLLSSKLRRAEDLVARYGGEEFLAVFPGADERAALSVVEDMRQTVEASSLGVTISAGVHVSIPADDSSVGELVATADKALYDAKHRGRNRIVKL